MIVKKCPNCGIQAESSNQFVCVKCGVKLKALPEKISPSNPPKNPFIAATLAFLLVGLGQVYLGQVRKGVTLFISAILVGLLTFGVGCIVMFVISPVDAYKIAQKLKAGQTVDQWEFF
jgi:TM2 domain-containing membrane protein YozV